MKKKLLTACSVAVLAATLSVDALAQETTAGVSGSVTGQNGAPLTNAEVIIVNDDNGLTRTVRTGSNGSFSVRNLPVGSGYSVSVSQAGYATETVEEVTLNLGQVASFNFDMDSSPAIEEVVVTGERSVVAQVAVGPNASFDLQTLQNSPAINRNIADIIRADARIHVDESRGDINAIQCGGKNSRFNSLTVDGVRMNDSFGLNSNGYPTERMPFSFDAINQVAVEMAPFDVQYGGFTACNINAVTKSGTNSLSGSIFFDYTSDDFRGGSIEGDQISGADYSEDRYGFTLGGPIIQDRAFFFVAYEELEGVNLFDRGAQGSNAVNEVDITQAEVDRIRRIAIDEYLYDPGTIPSNSANYDEKLLVKLDLQISDIHRASFTYNYNDGNNFTQSDGDNSELEFSRHLYERGAELNSYSATFYSDWNNRFSTEIRFGQLELDNRQACVDGGTFGEFRIETDDVDVYLGCDDSRQSNDLNYDLSNITIKGTYLLDDHTLSFGIERESLDIFNLFLQETQSEVRFDGIDNFELGFADAIYYENSIGSHNPEDSAAVWGYDLNTAYLQDEFFLGSDSQFQVVAGLRYDWYTSGDEPTENLAFTAERGFSNTATLDGKGLLQPRLGFTWDVSADTTVRGGIGLYSGGNPNVWLSNNFSNTKMLAVEARGRDYGLTDGSTSLFDINYQGLESEAPAGAGAGWGIPEDMYNAVTAGNGGTGFELNYLDPDFEIPSEWKIALGVSHFLNDTYIATGDLLITRGRDSAMVLRDDLVQTGTNADGYPIYDSPLSVDSFVLTNSGEGSRSIGISVALAADYDNGVDWSVGYAYNDAEDVQPMTSSVAFSNYSNRAFFDPQEDVLSTSDYNIAHRFTATLNYERAFFGDLMTRFSMFALAVEGAPYSYAYDGTINPYGFTPYLDFKDIVLEPGDERNANAGPWWVKADVRVEQQLPGLSADHEASAFLVIDNFTNLLNDEWGVLRDVGFPQTAEKGTDPFFRVGDASRYEIRFGVQYEF